MASEPRKTRAIGFVDFCDRVLGLKLTRGQGAVSAVCFDGATPAAMEGEGRAVAVEAFGGEIAEVPAVARRVVYIRAGRNSGKTTLAIARALHLLLTLPLEGVGHSDRACAIIVSPGIEFSKSCAQLAARMADDSEPLRPLITARTKSGFVMRRPDGREVEFIACAKSQGGRTTRGRSIVAGLLDECEFFPNGQSENNPVSDADIINAMMPRIVAGGQLILTSTPWPAPTASSELFDRNFGAPTYALTCCVPTPLARDNDPLIMATIAAERERDPANVEREYFCIPGASGASFFDPATIARAIAEHPLLASMQAPRTSAAADLAFKVDPATLVVVQRQKIGNASRLVVVHIEERRPRPGAPLRPSDVCSDFAAMAKNYGARCLVADSHYVETLREYSERHGLPVISAPGGSNGKLECFSLVREMLREGQLVIPNHPELLWQLRSVLRRATPGGGMTILSPRRSGQHGDIVSALTLACWQDRYQFGSIGNTYAGPMTKAFYGGSPARRIRGGVGW